VKKKMVGGWLLLFLLVTGAAGLSRADIVPILIKPNIPESERGKPEPIFFVDGQTELDDEQMESVKRSAAILKAAHPAAYVVIGYTEARGYERENLAVSQNMAEIVRAQLLKQGVDPEQVTAKGGGETKQFSERHDEAGFRLNRRVVIVPREE